MALEGVVRVAGKNSFNTNLTARSNLIKDVRDVVGRIHLTQSLSGPGAALVEAARRREGLGGIRVRKSECLSSRSRERRRGRMSREKSFIIGCGNLPLLWMLKNRRLRLDHRLLSTCYSRGRSEFSP